MTPSRRIFAAAAALVLLVGAAGLTFGWWYMAWGRYPFAGDLDHDFGDVAIGETAAEVRHAFRLTNRTGETVIIEEVRPTCSCTVAELSATEIAPGESVDVTVSLGLSVAGHKRKRLAIHIADFGVQNIWVEARGVKAISLSASQNTLTLAPGETRTLVIRADRQATDDPPPAPRLSAPQGVRARFVAWEPMSQGGAVARDVTRWRGRVEVEIEEGATLPDGAILEIALDGTAAAKVALRSRDD